MRDVAYWPKTFLDEIEEKTVDNGILFWALGGPSFVYRTPETMIWSDPYSYGTPDDAVPDAYRATAIPNQTRRSACCRHPHLHPMIM